MKKIFLLSGACKSGKTYLLRKVKKDLRGSSVTVYDMDTIQYWEEGAEKIDWDWSKVWPSIQGDESVKKRMELNLNTSLRWELLAKQKTIELLAKGENSLLINVLDRTEEDDPFYKILAKLFAVKLHFILVSPTYPRYRINLYKRKDSKNYAQTWGRRETLKMRSEYFDEVAVNSLLFGLRRTRKKLAALLRAK